MKQLKYLFAIFCICAISVIYFETSIVSAEELKGWIEVSVTVPENFNDQIYIQFQEEGNVDEAFSGNFVQIIPENGYVGRIRLPIGKYEITDKVVYEHPLIYQLKISEETELPVTVSSGGTAAKVSLICEAVPIEELPEIEGEYSEEILAAAKAASDKKAKEEATNETIENDVTNDVSPENNDSPEIEQSENETHHGPVYRIMTGLLGTILSIGVIGVIVFIIYKLKFK